MFNLVKQSTLDEAEARVSELLAKVAKLEEALAVQTRLLRNEELSHQATRNGWAAEKALIEEQVKSRIDEWNAAANKVREERQDTLNILFRERAALGQCEKNLDRVTALYESAQQEIASIKAERERLETTVRRSAQAHEETLQKLNTEIDSLKALLGRN